MPICLDANIVDAAILAILAPPFLYRARTIRTYFICNKDFPKHAQKEKKENSF